MKNLLLRDSVLIKEWTIVFTKFSKKNKSKQIFLDFMLYNKRNKNLFRSSSSLFTCILRKAPFGYTKEISFSRRFTKKIPFFFYLKESFRFIFKQYISKKKSLNSMYSHAYLLKNFFSSLYKFNLKSLKTSSDVSFLRTTFYDVKRNRFNRRFLW